MCVLPAQKASIASLSAGEQKNPSRKTWIFSFVPQAQHHLTEGQHHFERSENIIPHEAAQMNDVAASRK
jgi:hypothetical protein